MPRNQASSTTNSPTPRARVLAVGISVAVALVATALVLVLAPRTTTLPIGPAPLLPGSHFTSVTLKPIIHVSPYIVVDPPMGTSETVDGSGWTDADTRFLQEIENTTDDVRVDAGTEGAGSLVEAGEDICENIAGGVSPQDPDVMVGTVVTPWPGDQLAIVAAAQQFLCGQGGA